jgi:hypothetical protein
MEAEPAKRNYRLAFNVDVQARPRLFGLMAQSQALL